MKLLYVASYDVSDLRGGNGTDHFKMEALRQAGCDVIKNSPIRVHHSFGFRVYEGMRRRLTGRPRLTNLTRAVLQQIDRAVLNHPLYPSVDAVVCPNQFDASHYSGSKPLFIWTDSTYKNLVDVVPDHTSAPASIKYQGHTAQAATIARADGGMWSSHLAMRSAIDDYGADPHRQAVIPYGLNLWIDISECELRKIISNRSRDVLSLLFIGTDFERKGWRTALETVVDINRSGVVAHLSMVGGNPPIPTEATPFVKSFGWLNKYKSDDVVLLDSLLRKAHFLIMPTKADLYAMPAIEAMAYGCPPLISDVGGAGEVVRNGETGILFPLNASSSMYGAKLMELWSDWDAYERLCWAAYRHRKRSHDWTNLGNKAKSFMQRTIKNRVSG